MHTNQYTITAAVNNPTILKDNLYRSPGLLNNPHHKIIIKQDYPSASLAYNSAIDESDNDIIIFVHQDVYLSESWFDHLERSIDYLEQHRLPWGVLGAYGCRKWVTGGLGSIFTTGLGVHGNPVVKPEPVETLDEIVLVIKKSSGLRFDPNLPHFHLYGTDICLTARNCGLASYVIPGFCVHNTNQLLQLPAEYYECYWKIWKKWNKYLPIHSSCITISKFNKELYRRLATEFIRGLIGLDRKPARRSNDPRTLVNKSEIERIEANLRASYLSGY